MDNVVTYGDGRDKGSIGMFMGGNDFNSEHIKFETVMYEID